VLFAFAKLAGAAADPSTLVLCLSIAGAILLVWRRSSPWGPRLLFAGVGALAAVSILPVGTWLLRPLEDRFPPLQPLPAHVDGIISLGGAVDIDESEDRGTPSFNAHEGRMTAFIALARRYPGARLLFTGGSANPFRRKPSEAGVARAFFANQGLDPRRFLFEDASRNTRENALLSRQLVVPKPGEVWLLVTSASDMPRAMACFRAVGWPVIAAPADYHTKRYAAGFLEGPVRGLAETDWAVHEWIGLVYYRLRGWTPSLFPAPEYTP
jgi:uncharacterized SAM-binding protein YcdF (DUF218 family)